MSATADMIDGLEDAALFGRGKKRRRSTNPERAVQRAIIRRVAFHGIVCVHIKNEAARSMLGHINAKMDGLLPGFPDLIAMQAPGRVAFPECKEPGWKPPGPNAKGKDAQHYQRQCEVHAMLRRLGFVAGFVTSQEEAIALMREARFSL